ncbi:hypothetical protein SUDANB95_02189 [Actinosynnema sp. ALI-1.44]
MTTFTTPTPITANLTTAGAQVRVVASPRSGTVVQVRPLNSANKTDVKVAEKTKVEFSGGDLRVETTKSGDRRGSVAITIELPAGSDLVLNTAWTDVRAEGDLGDCRLSTLSGSIRLERVSAVRGNVVEGAVEIGHVAGAVEVDGGAGGLRLGEVVGEVRYAGSSGEVWIGHAHADVHLGGSNGSFTIDRADGNVTAEGANCPIRVGRMAGGQAHLANASGGIEVGVARDVTAEVDATTTKGTVRNTLPTPTTAAPILKLHARTRLNDIRIHPATT